MRRRRVKIPIRFTGIKLTCCLWVGLGLFSGCAGPSALAPFPARPDTVVAGDLRGPFEGQVLDADSGKVVEGATVVGSWAWEVGRGFSGPERAESQVAETGADGFYRLPAAPDSDVGAHAARLTRFTLVVYKRGYVAWRSDRRFADLSPRHDFAQGGNIVRLERLPADVSHSRHLAFVGASGPLLSHLAWELPLAAQEVMPAAESTEGGGEVTPRPRPTSSVLPPDPNLLITIDEIKAVTGWKGDFTATPLPDIAPGPTYDSVHFQSEVSGQKGDAAIRLWRLPGEEAEQLYDGLSKQLENVKRADEMGDRSFRSEQKVGGQLIYGIVTLDRAHGVVVLFSCGKALCKDADTVAALGKRMVSRLGRLGRGAAATPSVEEGEEQKATPPAPSGPGPLRLKPPELR